MEECIHTYRKNRDTQGLLTKQKTIVPYSTKVALASQEIGYFIKKFLNLDPLLECHLSFQLLDSILILLFLETLAHEWSETLCLCVLHIHENLYGVVCHCDCQLIIFKNQSQHVRRTSDFCGQLTEPTRLLPSIRQSNIFFSYGQCNTFLLLTASWYCSFTKPNT